MSRTRKEQRGGARAGFTLIELVVAILILTIGILGLAGTSAVITRQMGSGAKQTLAAAIAQSRIETVRSQACETLVATTGGPATTSGLTESWTIVPGTRRVDVTVTVSYDMANGTKTFPFSSSIPCI